MKDYELRAHKKYAAKAMRRYGISFNKLTEPELVKWMDSRPNKSDYVRQLVLADMEKKQPK